MMESIKKSQEAYIQQLATYLSDSGGIQTHNLLIRSQMLYSVELRNLRFLICGCKGKDFF